MQGQHDIIRPMLSQQEEQQIRDTVRRSLGNILRENPGAVGGTPTLPAELERLSDAKRIIAEETERYYQALGLVKHVSREGQVYWVTPAEHDRLMVRRRRHRRSHGLAWLRGLNPRVALVWAATILLAILLVAYLLSSEVIARFSS
jgi:hypothetical protein